MRPSRYARGILALGLLASLVSAPALADIPSSYAVTQLGSPGGLGGALTGMNNLGDVVGVFFDGSSALGYWHNGTDWSLVGMMPGEYGAVEAVNDGRFFAGNRDILNGPRFWEHPADYGHDLIGLGGGGWAADLNSGDDVVGTSAGPGGLFRAVFWDHTDWNNPINLGAAGEHLESQGWAVNASRAVAGNSFTIGGDNLPSLWLDSDGDGRPDAGGANALSVPAGFAHARALDINDSGLVVGVAGGASGATVLWTWSDADNDGVVETETASVLSGITQAEGVSINGMGLIAGTDSLGVSFIYDVTADRFARLSDLVPDPLPAGLHVVAINDAGQIVAYSDVAGEYLRLDPMTEAVPEPVSMLFFGTGLVGVAGLIKRRRVRRAA